MFQARFLLTSKCSARCGYCHNEGQDKDEKMLMSVARVRQFMEKWQAQGQLPNEVVLSGGEPTLHPHLVDIAKLCSGYGVRVSMDSHGGHPDRLAKALPYVNELKLHIDAFDEDAQYKSMGIRLAPVMKSIEYAKAHQVALLVNHPMQSVEQTTAFVQQAASIGVDCKIIEVLDVPANLSTGCLLVDIDWQGIGYVLVDEDTWFHAQSAHRVYHKRCGVEHQRIRTLYIDANQVKEGLNGPSVQDITFG
jgi:molybdenum cofactor biosynthesis enzyme MoaA